MSDALLVSYLFWPLIVGLAISAVFWRRVGGSLNAVLVLIFVYGLQGLCHLLYDITRLVMLQHHSPNYMNYSPWMNNINLAGEVLAFILALAFSSRFTAMLSRRPQSNGGV